MNESLPQKLDSLDRELKEGLTKLKDSIGAEFIQLARQLKGKTKYLQ